MVQVYAATVLSLLHRLTGSCTGLTMFAFAGAVLKPTSRRSTTRCDRRPRARASQGSTRFATLYTDIYWRWWQVSERDRLFENRTAKIDPLNISSIILLIYYIIELLCTLFFVCIWQPCGAWSVVCKQCLLKNAQRFFADLFTYIDQVNNKCCIKLQLATCLLLSALRCIYCIRCVGGRCFAQPLWRCFRLYR